MNYQRILEGLLALISCPVPQRKRGSLAAAREARICRLEVKTRRQLHLPWVIDVVGVAVGIASKGRLKTQRRVGNRPVRIDRSADRVAGCAYSGNIHMVEGVKEFSEDFKAGLLTQRNQL